MIARAPVRLLALALLALDVGTIPNAGAQDLLPVSPGPASLLGQPLVLRPVDLFADAPRSPAAAAGQPAHIRLFRMPSGFLTEPLGLVDDDDPPPDGTAANPCDSDLDSRMQIALGRDNPFLDFRRAGEPGGAGYYRVDTQLQLLEGKTGGVTFELQTVAPAGIDSDGVASGPTVLSPSLAWFQDVGGGTALQGFVGKHVPANAQWMPRLEHGLRYGVALQRPLIEAWDGRGQSLHFFVEALGGYHRFVTVGPSNYWELLPGVHWHITDDCWLSGGLAVPMGPPRPESKLWQISCGWHF
jgi:hypothetical protein